MGDLALAVDTGKNATKAVSRINGSLQKFAFRTKMQIVENFDIDIPRDTYLTELEGNHYLVGEAVGEEHSNYDLSKHSVEHRVAIYLAIALFLERKGPHFGEVPTVSLAINVPVSLYKNASQKARYTDFIQTNHEVVSMVVNGRTHRFRINQVLALPEGMGPIYNQIDRYRGERAIIFDIGGLNTSYSVYDQLVPKIDSMFGGNQGIHSLRAAIQEALTSTYGVSVSTEDAERVMVDGRFAMNGVPLPDSATLIEKLKHQHVESILAFAKAHGLTLNNSTLVFAGGGSVLLQEAIEEMLPTAVVDEAGRYSNVLSYHRLMEAKDLV